MTHAGRAVVKFVIASESEAIQPPWQQTELLRRYRSSNDEARYFAMAFS
jgi:hypothetical protein